MKHYYTFDHTVIDEDGCKTTYTMRTSITDEQIEELIQKSKNGDEEALKKAAYCISRCGLEVEYESWLKTITDKNRDAEFALRRLRKSRPLIKRIRDFFGL